MPVTWDGDDQDGWQTRELPGTDLADLAPARRWAEERLATLGEDHRIDVLLVLAELLDNAYRYTDGTVQLRLNRLDDPCEITVAVADTGRDAPRLRVPDDEGGRGLHLVDRICSAWGTSHHDDGKVVWGRIACARSGAACPSASSAGAGGSR